MYGNYEFKTQGRMYRFILKEDGFIHCDDLNLKAETVEALKPLVVAAVREEKKLPRIPMLFIGGRWYGSADKINYGSASGKADHRGERWASYEEDGKQRRGKFGKDALYLDTPENRQLADNIVSTQREIASLQRYIEDIKSQMPKVGDPVEVKVSL